MIMLFLAFLDIDFHSKVLTALHGKVLFFNLLIPVSLFLLLSLFDLQLAMSAFVIAIAPTAAGAPVITSFLRARVAFVTVSVILTSPIIALVLPFLMPLLLGPVGEVSVLDLILPILSLVFIPLIISSDHQAFFPKAASFPAAF